MTRPRVLVVTTTFPRFDGDAVPARFVFDLSAELSRWFTVTVLAPHDPGAAFRETLGPLEVLRFPYFYPVSAQRLCDGVGILPNVRSSLLGKLQAPALFIAQTRALRRLLRERAFDLIHSHWLIPSGFDVARVARPASTGHVMTIHSSDVHLLRHLPLGARVTRRALRGTDRVFVVSSHLKSILDELAGRPTPATVLPMGFNPAVFAPEHASARVPGRVLYVGKLIPVKGVEHLIRAFPSVRRSRPDATLRIVGGGVLRGALEQLTDSLGLRDAVTFTGPLPHDEVQREYASAGVVTAPSIINPGGETEGLPVVILEALASGVPVVATRVGSLHDVVRPGENGDLVTPADPEALARALIAMMDRDNPGDWSARCAQSVERFAWPRIAEEYRSAFEAVMAERGATPSAPGPKPR